ncbi:hypothetical protein LCGC14_1835160, partial [marine sediment metagenome]
MIAPNDKETNGMNELLVLVVYCALLG